MANQSLEKEAISEPTNEDGRKVYLIQGFPMVALLPFAARTLSTMGCSPVHGRVFIAASLCSAHETPVGTASTSKLWQPKLPPDFAKYLLRGMGRGGKRTRGIVSVWELRSQVQPGNPVFEWFRSVTFKGREGYQNQLEGFFQPHMVPEISVDS